MSLWFGSAQLMAQIGAWNPIPPHFFISSSQAEQPAVHLNKCTVGST